MALPPDRRPSIPGATPDVAPDFRVERQPFAGKVALITGGTRDIGAGIARKLARGGALVILGYAKNEKPAQAISQELTETGASFEIIKGDITTGEGMQALVDAVNRAPQQNETRDGVLDYLFINAASSTYELNVEASQNLIDIFLLEEKIKRGGKIVYMQSVPGHYNSVLKSVGLIPPVYTDVAENKDLAERSLWGRVDEMNERGVSFVLACAPAVSDTTNIRLFTRRDPEAAGKFRELSEKLGLPETMTINQVSERIVQLLAEDTGKSHFELFGPYRDGRNALGKLYGENAMYVDVKNTKTGEGRMIVTPERVNKQYEIIGDSGMADADGAEADFKILPEHAAGHFAESSGLPLVLPAHKQIRMAVQTLGDVASAAFEFSEDEEAHVRLRGFTSAEFKRPVKPGDWVRVTATTKKIDGKFIVGDATIMVDDEVAAEIKGLTVEMIDEADDEEILLEDQLIEGAAQSAGLEYLSDPERNPLFLGIGRVSFADKRLKVGDVARFIDHSKQEGRREFSGSVLVQDQDGNNIAEINDMRALLSTRMVKRALGVVA